MNKTYLGDGVYVNFDGRDLVLTTEDGMSTTNLIVLESGVVGSLLAYIEGIRLEEKKRAAMLRARE